MIAMTVSLMSRSGEVWQGKELDEESLEYFFTFGSVRVRLLAQHVRQLEHTQELDQLTSSTEFTTKQ